MLTAKNIDKLVPHRKTERRTDTVYRHCDFLVNKMSMESFYRFIIKGRANHYFKCQTENSEKASSLLFSHVSTQKENVIALIPSQLS